MLLLLLQQRGTEAERFGGNGVEGGRKPSQERSKMRLWKLGEGWVGEHLVTAADRPVDRDEGGGRKIRRVGQNR